MADFGDSPYKPSQDEIIYEFKYAFPKGTLNRIARIIDRICCTIILIACIILLDFFITEILLLVSQAVSIKDFLLLSCMFLLLFSLFTILILHILHNLLLAPCGEILLSHKGMYIKGTHQFSLWNKQRSINMEILEHWSILSVV